VILAGGISSRMRKPADTPLDARLALDADQKSKSMIGVGKGRRPFLDYLLYNAEAAGYRDVIIVVGEKDSSIRGYYGQETRNNTFRGVSISYAVQQIPSGRTKPLGTADALLQGLLARPDWQGQHFTVVNSDNLYSRRALGAVLETSCSMIDYDRDALQFSPARVQQFAVVQKDKQGRLLDIIEKPTVEQIELVKDANGRVGVSMNIFRFPTDRALTFLRKTPLHPERQEKELPASVKMMIEDSPGCMITIPLAEQVPDLTNREDIAIVQRYLEHEFPEFDTRDG
jgi:NDP-sugar pyrophosphorylase family protein